MSIFLDFFIFYFDPEQSILLEFACYDISQAHSWVPWSLSLSLLCLCECMNLESPNAFFGATFGFGKY